MAEIRGANMSNQKAQSINTTMQGIVPGIHRQFLFTGLRLGLFQRVQDYFSGKPFGPLHHNCMPPLLAVIKFPRMLMEKS